MLNHGTHNACRALRPHGDPALGLDTFTGNQSLEVLARYGSEHLLRYDIGGLAYSANEQLSQLNDRGLDRQIPV